MYGTSKCKCHQETSTQTATNGGNPKNRSYCESLISTLLETDTYQFAKTIDSLQKIEENDNQKIETNRIRFAQQEIRQFCKHCKEKNKCRKPENTDFTKTQSDSSLTQTSYKSCPKDKTLLMTKSRIKTCYQRISPLLNKYCEKTNSNLPKKPIISNHKQLLDALENACKIKKDNISHLETKKQEIDKILKHLSCAIGDTASLDVENIEQLSNSKKALEIDLEYLTKENQEFKLDYFSYQEILRDDHPTFSLLSLIKNGLAEEYVKKKAVINAV